MNNFDHPIQSRQRTSRITFLSLLKASLACKEYRFTRQAAIQWLAAYPGDLEVSLYYAQGLLGEDRIGQAKPILKGLCQADPEYIDAVETLARLDFKQTNNYKQPSQAKNPEIPSQDSVTALSRNTIYNWLISLKGDIYDAERMSDPKTPDVNASSWGKSIWRIHKNLAEGNINQAEIEIPSVLALDPPTPLAGLTHLQVLEANPLTPLPAKRSLAEHYHRQWPDCLAISLLLADWQLQEGSAGQAVALIHQVATRDIAGQVPARLWGQDHPYKNLWPEPQEIRLEFPIPANITAQLGWNRLQAGSAAEVNESEQPDKAIFTDKERTGAIGIGLYEIAHSNAIQSETIPGQAMTTGGSAIPSNSSMAEKVNGRGAQIKKEQARLAAILNKPDITQTDNRFPVYVILSSHSNLIKQYGIDGDSGIEKEMQRLAVAIQLRRRVGNQGRWGSFVFLPDVEASVSQYGLKPVTEPDPWSLKLALKDLDAAMARRGEMIGALLIIGGPEIIPFHLLPNPVDDMDHDVPSDNPYGALDENYFIQQWPIGRMPGSSDNDPKPLMLMLRNAIQQHSNASRTASSRRLKATGSDNNSYSHWWSWLTGWFPQVPLTRRPGFGYTAAIWRNASSAVFRPVSSSVKLIISPPMGLNRNGSGTGSSNNHNGISLPNAQQGYFNLHGLSDAPEWYGQRDPQEPGDDPDYPVALRPEDVRKMERHIPQVVFSEACYGAYLEKKTVDQAMALQFLASGCLAVVGSTCIAYGAINAPLIAADLLGFAFWKLLQEGHAAGEALRRAKIQLADEMSKRQGYLDGEDQKTLISFILLGDPLARTVPKPKSAKNIARPIEPSPGLKTICDRSDQVNEEIPPEITTYVNKLVAYYLPGMSDAELLYTTERARCPAEGHTCPTSQFKGKGASAQQPDRHLVTLSKQIEKGGRIHPQFARLTLDSKGKLVKFVVSR